MKNFKNYSDQEIIDCIKSDNEDGYKAIFYNRTMALKKYVMSNGGDHFQADNIEQKTILILYEKIISGTFRLNPDTKLSTYLYSIGKNLWLKELNKIKKSKLDAVDLSLHGIGNEIDNFESELQDKHEKILIELLDKIDDDCSKILLGKFYENRSDEEISKLLGTISKENVRKRRYKCIQKLKRKFFQRLHQNG